ncbi:MAG: von Willebrand factor type A domain-containing protein, partial [Planctomycetota bacterium]
MSRNPADYLTAYADGQLSPAGVIAMEQALAEQPELRAKLEEIRALQAALRNLPPAPESLRPVTRSLLMSRAEAGWKRKPTARRIGFVWYAAAACLVLAMAGLFTVTTAKRESFAESAPVALAAQDRFHANKMATEEAYELNQQHGTLLGGEKSGYLGRRRAPTADESMKEREAQDDVDRKDDAGTGSERLAAHKRAEKGKVAANGRAQSRQEDLQKLERKLLDAPVEGHGDKKADGVTAVTERPASPSVNERRDGKRPMLAVVPGNTPARSVGDALRNNKDAHEQKSQSVLVIVPVPGSDKQRDVAQSAAELGGISAFRKSREWTESDHAQGPAYGYASKQLPDISATLNRIAAQSPDQLAAGLANSAPSPLLDLNARQRLINLSQHYQVPVSLSQDAERMLGGLTQLAPATGLSAGEQVVMLAHRAGLQTVMGSGRLVINTTPNMLDPTDRLGLDVPAFTAAFGTPPMAIVRTDARLTFALDADTSSFDRARSDIINNNRLPDPATIRPEHFINAVPADYPTPTGSEAFALYAEAGPAPFARGRMASRTAMVAVGVVGRAAKVGERKALRLVIAVDASGSMARPGALDRARLALHGLTAELSAEDRVAVVSFSERGRVLIPIVTGSEKADIHRALDGVVPSGATNTAEGLALACQVAREIATPGTALRVVLVTDGAAIAGADEVAACERMGALRSIGGSLLILGVGERAADTRALDALTKAGDGQQVFLGSNEDAQRAVQSTLLPERLTILARDAKAQVTWNPERVTHARLIGYERRRLAHTDFRDDRVDAGEIPSATVVTALFEVILADGGSGPLGTAAVR